MMPSPTFDRSSIAATHAAIQPHVRWTPVLQADRRDFGLEPGTLAFKLELLQHSGSFKVRGAFANLLTRPVPPAGVAAASGGNHGAAVAYAARELGIRATIFVPGIVSPAKAERIRASGADMVVVGERYADALHASEQFVRDSGAMPVHAFDEPATILGQGTTALELERDRPDIDTLLVAVGGGGLIGGIAAWYGGRVRVVAVEPEQSPTLHAAFAAGEPVDAEAGGIAADSLAPRRVGTLMFGIARRHVDPHVVLVPDEAIVGAQRALWEHGRIVAEPGGAAAFAALLSGGYVPERDERVAVLLCGGNTNAVDFGLGSTMAPQQRHN